MARSNNSCLYVFATYEEFLGVFPETAVTVSRQNITNNIICLLEPAVRGSYAFVAGVGLLEFSANLARVLSQSNAELRSLSGVVNVGICGTYPQSGLQVGDVVNVVSDRVGDLGFQEFDGSFVPWRENRTYGHSNIGLDDYLESQNSLFPFAKGLPRVSGLTVNCCTGTEEQAKSRYETFGCAVESMEGASAFALCDAFGLPAIEIRAVSNIASTRDKSRWKIKEALEKLHQLFT